MVTVNREPRIHIAAPSGGDVIRGMHQVVHHLETSEQRDLLAPATRVLDSLVNRFEGPLEDPGNWRLRPPAIRFAAGEIRKTRTTITTEEQNRLLLYLRGLHDQAQSTFADFVVGGPDLTTEPLQTATTDLTERFTRNPRVKTITIGNYKKRVFGGSENPKLVVVQAVDAQPASVKTNHNSHRYVITGGDTVESIQVFNGTPVSLAGVRSRHLYLTESKAFSVEESKFGEVFVEGTSTGRFHTGEAGEIRIRSAGKVAVEDYSTQQIHVRDSAILTAFDVETDLLAVTSNEAAGFHGDAYKTSAYDRAEIVIWGDPGAQFINGEQQTERVRPTIII